MLLPSSDTLDDLWRYQKNREGNKPITCVDRSRHPISMHRNIGEINAGWLLHVIPKLLDPLSFAKGLNVILVMIMW